MTKIPTINEDQMLDIVVAQTDHGTVIRVYGHHGTRRTFTSWTVLLAWWPDDLEDDRIRVSTDAGF